MTSDVRLPSTVVAELAPVLDGRLLRLTWENQAGGLTFEVTGVGDRMFLKWSPHTTGIDLTHEAERLRWAGQLTSVPVVVAHGRVTDGSWMLTKAIAGLNAVAPRWKANPRTAVVAIATGLRHLHDALPIEDCPFSWSAADRLVDARQRAARGVLDPAQWHPEHQHLSVNEALDLLADPPSPTTAVVCHGDTCAPNTLLDSHGRFVGHVDLGALGIADPWADLAIATWSTTWNYGPGWDHVLLDTYGVQPDPQRTSYYRLLWDLGP